MILLQTKRLENNLPISQLWTSTKAYMRYAFLLNFLMIPIGCFATDTQDYSQGDYYELYWGSARDYISARQIAQRGNRKTIFVHESCNVEQLRNYLGVKRRYYLVLNEKESRKTVNFGLRYNGTLKRFFSEHPLPNAPNGKEVITPDGKVKFDELLKTSSATPQQSANQTPIQNNNTNGGSNQSDNSLGQKSSATPQQSTNQTPTQNEDDKNDGNNQSDNSLGQTSSAKPQQSVNQTPIQNEDDKNDGNNESQEQQLDLQQNGDTNNEGNKINYSVPMSLILVAIVCVASYRLFRSKKRQKKIKKKVGTHNPSDRKTM